MSDSSSAPTTTTTAPAPAPWSPSEELKAFTSLLIRGQLTAIADRTRGLIQLLHFTSRLVGAPRAQIHACSTIKNLPFLRMNLAMRSDPLNAEFITAGRKFNRELLDAKADVGNRLHALTNDQTLPSNILEFAARINGRTPILKVDHGELNDVEIPAHLLPPHPKAQARPTSAAKAAATAEAKAARDAINQAARKAKSDAKAHEDGMSYARKVLSTLRPGQFLKEATEHARDNPLITPEMLASLAESTREIERLQRENRVA